MSGELKSCPFCGGVPKVRSCQSGEDTVDTWIVCTSCGASSDRVEDAYSDPGSAALIWNARADAARQDRPDPTGEVGEEPLSHEWLGEIGFKWHQGDRQPDKHWRLWLGWAANPGHATLEDLGIEVSPLMDGERWFCWLLRGPHGGDGFIHVRYLRTRGDLLELIEALTGRPWDRNLSRYGNLYTPEQARAAISALIWEGKK